MRKRDFMGLWFARVQRGRGCKNFGFVGGFRLGQVGTGVGMREC